MKMSMLRITAQLAPAVEDSSPTWAVTIVTSGVGRVYAVPDPVGMGPLHAVQEAISHHLAPVGAQTRPGFACLPE